MLTICDPLAPPCAGKSNGFTSTAWLVIRGRGTNFVAYVRDGATCDGLGSLAVDFVLDNGGAARCVLSPWLDRWDKLGSLAVDFVLDNGCAAPFELPGCSVRSGVDLLLLAVGLPSRCCVVRVISSVRSVPSSVISEPTVRSLASVRPVALRTRCTSPANRVVDAAEASWRTDRRPKTASAKGACAVATVTVV